MIQEAPLRIRSRGEVIADMANAYMLMEAFTALKKAELDGIGFIHGQAVANEAVGDLGDTDEWVRMEEIRMAFKVFPDNAPSLWFSVSWFTLSYEALLKERIAIHSDYIDCSVPPDLWAITLSILSSFWGLLKPTLRLANYGLRTIRHRNCSQFGHVFNQVTMTLIALGLITVCGVRLAGTWVCPSHEWQLTTGGCWTANDSSNVSNSTQPNATDL